MNRQYITFVIFSAIIHASVSISLTPSDHLLPPPVPQRLIHVKQPSLPYHNQIPPVLHENSQPPGLMTRIARWFGLGSPTSEQQLQPAASVKQPQYKNAPPMNKNIGFTQLYPHLTQQYVSNGNEKATCGLCNKFPWVPVFPQSIQLPISNYYKQPHWNQPEQQASQYHQQFHPPLKTISSQRTPVVQREIKFNFPLQSKQKEAVLPSSQNRGNHHNFKPPINQQQTHFIPIPVPNLSPAVIPPLFNAQPFRPILQKPQLPLKAETSSYVESYKTNKQQITQSTPLPTQIPPTQPDTQISNSDSTFEIVKSHQLTDFVSSVEYPATFVQSHMVDIPDSTKITEIRTQPPSTQNPSETFGTQPTQTAPYSVGFTIQQSDSQANTIDYQRGAFNGVQNNNPNQVILTELGSFDASHYDQYTPSPLSLAALPVSGSVFPDLIDTTDQHPDSFNDQSIVVTQNLQQNEIFFGESDNFPSASSHNLTSVRQDNILDNFDPIQQQSSAEIFLNQQANEDFAYTSTVPTTTTIQTTEFGPEYIHQTTISDENLSIGTTITETDNQRQYDQIRQEQHQKWLEEQQKERQKEEQRQYQQQILQEEQIKNQELQKQEEERRQEERIRQFEDIQKKQELERLQLEEHKQIQYQLKIQQEEERNKIIQHALQKQLEEQQKKHEQQNAERLLRRQREQLQNQKIEEQINSTRQQQELNLPNNKESLKTLLNAPIYYNWNIHSSPRPFTHDSSDLDLGISSTQKILSTHTPPVTTPEDASPTSVYTSTDASGHYAGMSPPQPHQRRQVNQIIIPYTTKNKPRPFELPTRHSSDFGGRYDKWSHANDLEIHEQQESKLVRTATEAPPSSKRTTKYLTKIVASNLRELLKREHAIKNTSTFDFSKLQKNIDDWTEQEFTSLSHKPSTVSIRGRSKHIPTEYLTTSTPSMRQSKTTQFQNLPHFSTSINNLLTSRGSKRYEFPSVVDNQISDYSDTTSTTKMTSSSIPSYIRAISSTKKPREAWHQARVSISPKTKEKVYVVTPLPRYVPHSFALTTTTTTTTKAPKEDESSSVGRFKSPRFLVRPTPASGSSNFSTTSDSPRIPYTPELFGLMGISAYIPPAPVETIDGHSKVITVVTPSNGSNYTVAADDSSRNHRLDDPVIDQLSSNTEREPLS